MSLSERMAEKRNKMMAEEMALMKRMNEMGLK